ncbi:MAG: hypothetical protein ACRBBK_09010 [Paracoccaceae bacterium]
MKIPAYLKQGEEARLFPVLATTSKEGRTTSILLACLSKIDEFGAALIETLDQRVGARSHIDTYTEIVFQDEKAVTGDRPDGLIVVRNGAREWKALVEAKVGNAELGADQVERYRGLAKSHGIDCVVTISNQFATHPRFHPLKEIAKSRSSIPVFHWSWMFILTNADLLLSKDRVSDTDQRLLLNELRRFLSHESAGVRGFDRMPAAWGDLNKLVSAGGNIPAKSDMAVEVINAWHQETKDLSLILSRQTETHVGEKLSRKHANDPSLRAKDELSLLREEKRLVCNVDIEDAAAPLEIIADIPQRRLEVGMSLRAPEDRKSSRARVSWLLKQVKTEKTGDLFVRLLWPGSSEDTQFSFDELVENPLLCEEGKGKLQVHSFHIFYSRKIGAKFAQQANFIVELERIVPDFYGAVGQNLSEWRKRAPKIKEDRATAEEVQVEALAEDAESGRG